MTNNEKLTTKQESFDEQKLAEHGKEQQERLKEDRERAAEKSHEQSVDSARQEVERATERQEHVKEASEQEQSKAPERRGKISKADREKSFDSTMKEARSQMSSSSRVFSDFIHNPAVEKVSDVVGGTIARPNAISAGAFSAFLVTLVVYLIARNYGYPLSGTETIASFALGWVIGLIFDYFRVLIRGGK